jgi:glycine cleavage system transcriptional repressor
MKKIIISVLGNDRPGIIATVSRVLLENDGNIENVSQTSLQLIFAGIFIAAMPVDTRLDELERTFRERLEPMGLHVHLLPMGIADTPSLPVTADPFVVTTRGPDRKGLVAEISAVLASHHANITNLQAVFKGGSDPNANIMIYEVDIPHQSDHEALFRDLRSRAAALDLKISIQHREVFNVMNRI